MVLQFLNNCEENLMVKDILFSFVLAVALLVLFTNVGFDVALSGVGKALDFLFAFVSTL